MRKSLMFVLSATLAILLSTCTAFAQIVRPVVPIVTDQSALNLSNNFGQVSNLWVDAAGDVAFGDSQTSAVFLQKAGAKTPIRLFQSGDPVPGEPGAHADYVIVHAINSTGAVAFSVIYEASGFLASEMFVSDGTSLKEIADSAQLAPGGVIPGRSMTLNDAGDTAFALNLQGATAKLYVAPAGSAPVVVAAIGSSAPGGTLQTINPAAVPVGSRPSFNNNGELLFSAMVNGNPGLYVASIKNGIRKIAANGDPAPGGGTFNNFNLNNVAINNLGQVVFIANVTTNSGTRRSIWVSDPAKGLTEIVSTSSTTPIAGGGLYAAPFAPVFLNDEGDVVFPSNIVGNPTTNTGIFRGQISGAATQAVAYSGESAPGVTGATFVSFSSPVSINSSGAVVFAAQLSNGQNAIYTQTGTNTPSLIALDGQASGDGGNFSLAGSQPRILGDNSVVFPTLENSGPIFAALFHAGTGSFTKLVNSSDPLPSGAGVSLRNGYVSSAGPFLTFFALHTGGQVSAFVLNSSSGAITKIASDGDSIPGITGTRLVIPAGVVFGGNIYVNASGAVALDVNLASPASNAAVLLWTSTQGLVKLAADGDVDAATGQKLVLPQTVATSSFDVSQSPINSQGAVLISTTLSPSGQKALYLGSAGSAPSKVIATGDSIGGLTIIDGTNNGLGTAPQLNSNGQVAVNAILSDGSEGIFLTNAGGPVSKIVKSGDLGPNGGAFTEIPGYFSLNNSGEVAFFAGYGPASNGVSSAGVFIGTASNPPQSIALDGAPAPSGGNFSIQAGSCANLCFENLPNDVLINDEHDVAFSAALTGGAPNSGYFLRRGTQGVLQTVALQGQPAPGTNFNFTTFTTPGGDPLDAGVPGYVFALGANGELAFQNEIPGQTLQAVIPDLVATFYYGLDNTLTKVIAPGDSAPGIIGGQITQTSFGPGLLTNGLPVFWAATPGSSATADAIYITANPVPVAGTLAPPGAAVGQQVNIKIAGSSIVPGAVVRFNGTDYPGVSSADGTTISATIPATALQSAGPVPVSVVNPAPGGGASNALSFTISAPATPSGTMAFTPPSGGAGLGPGVGGQVNLGDVFTVNSDVWVTSLGFYALDGFNPYVDDEIVTIYDNNGNPLTSATVSHTEPAIVGYFWRDVAPVQLHAGQQYTISAWVSNNGWESGPAPATPAQVSFNSNRYLYAPSPAYPTQTIGAAGPAYYGANFTFVNAAPTTVPGISSTALIPGGLTNWYRAEGNALDTQSNANGALNNGVGFTAGEAGNAFSFNAATQSNVTLPSPVGSFGTNDFSVDFWFNTTQAESFGNPITLMGNRVDCSDGNFFSVRMYSSNSLFVELDEDANHTNYNSVQAASGLNDGKWHHVAIVRQGTTLLLYLDGRLAGSSSSSAVTNVTGGNPFVLGSSPCASSYTGALDEIHIFNRSLSLAEVESIYNAGSAGLSTLVGWWGFNEGTGNTAADLSGNGNTGTLTGSTLPAWTTDVPPVPYSQQYSLSFDGVTSSVNIENGATDPALNFQTQVSMAAWVKPSSVPAGTYGIISKPRATAGTGWALRMENSDPNFGLINASANCSVHAASNPFTPGVWTHVAATYDSSTSTVQLFVNGASVPVDNQACSGPLLVAATPLLIGQEFANGGLGRGFPGEISDARVYNRVLSSAEVAALAGTSSSITASASPNPLTYGQLTTLTANVLGGGSSAMDGQVRFFDDQTEAQYGVAQVQNGTATLFDVALPVGSRVIVATYSGSASLPNTATKFVVRVNPAILTVTPDTKSITYGEVLPTLTATITGFVNGDTTSVLTGAPALSTPVAALTPAGTYPIFAAQGTLTISPNYSLAFAVGTLTVTPAASVTLPAATQSTITQGGAPNYTDTYTTPFAAPQNGWITAWQTEFTGGLLANGLAGVPAGVQLKVFRNVSGSLQVVAQGAVHDPRPLLQQRFGTSYLFFTDTASLTTFTESPIPVLAGDLLGITVYADPVAGAYFYPLVGPAGTLLVTRNVLLGQSISAADPFTTMVANPPALSFTFYQASASNPLTLMNNFLVTGDYSAAGVTLRGLGVGGFATGTITIPTSSQDATNGIPQGAEPVGAFLYWETLENTPSSSGNSGKFRSYSITGQQIGNDVQYTDGNFTGTLRVYRADVLPYFAVTNGVRIASGPHSVSLPDSGGTALPLTEGASLVVIYRVISPNFPLKAVVLYDGSATPANNTNLLQVLQGFYDADSAGGKAQARTTNIYSSGGSWNNSTTTLALPDDSSEYGATLTPGAWGAMVLSTLVKNTDHDGVLNAWKIGPPAPDFHAGQPGYYDVKYGQWIPLPGAALGQRDLFVQMDYMCSSVLANGTCDPAGRSELPVTDAQGHDPLLMLQQVFANHGIALHLQIGNAIQAETCTDSPGQLCEFPNEPGVSNWKLGIEIAKVWPRNAAACGSGGDCSPRFPFGAKDSYHYVLMADSLAIPAWNTTWGTLTGITVANGITTISTTDRGQGINACPSRITITGALGNPALNGVYNTTGCGGTTSMTISTPNVPNWSYPNNTLPEPVLGVTSGTVSSISGFSDLGGADSVISLGKWETSPNQDMSKRANVQAGTILHEVGHTLGLSHGGTYYDTQGAYNANYEANCKPNYQSVMNYLFQLDGVGPDHALDFSGQTLQTLNESTASQTTQLADVSGFGGANYPTSAWYAPVLPGSTATPATRHCDGSPLIGDKAYRIDGPIAPIAPPWSDGQDVNFDGQLNTEMRGYNDWANLDLRQIGSTSGEFVALANLLSFGNLGSPLNVSAGGTVTLGSGGTVALGSGGTVTLGSGGTASLSSGGTIALGAGGNVTLGSGGTVTLGSAGTITMGSGGNVVLGSAGAFTLGSSGGTITMGSGGTVTLGSAGTVTLGGGGTIALGSGGTVVLGAGGSYALDSSGGTIILGSGGNVILGSGGNIVLGSGGLVALGAGGTIALGSGGTVALGSGGTIALGSGGTVALGSGGTVTLGSGGTIALGSGGTVTLGSGGNVTLGSGGTVTLGSGGDAALASGGNVTLGGGGTVALGSGGNVTLGSGGNVTLGSGGTIALGSGGTVTLGSGGNVTLGSAGTVALGSGGNVTLGSGGTVTLGSGGLVTLGSGGTVTLGSGGTITLGSGGSYTGSAGDVISLGAGGTIALGSGGTIALGSGGNVTLGSGGTITLGSGGNVTLGSGGNVTLGSGGTITLGSGGTVTLGSGGNVTLGSGGNVTLGSGGTIALGSGGNVTLGSGGNTILGSGGNVTLGSGGNTILGSGGNITLGSGGTIALGSGGNVTLGSGGSYALGSGGTVALGSGGTVALGSGGNIALGSGGTIALGSGGVSTVGSEGGVTLGSGGASALSEITYETANSVARPPQAPTLMQTTVGNTPAVVVNWQSPIFGVVTSYTIYRSDNGGPPTAIGTVTGNPPATTFTDTNPSGAAKVAYTISSGVVDSTNNTTLQSPPSVPALLAQTITFTALPNAKVGDSVAVSATASSGLPVNFSTTGSCALAGQSTSPATVSATAAGGCTVTASQAGGTFGNSTYAAAMSVAQTFSIAPATQTLYNQSITFPGLGTHSFGDPDFTLLAMASSNLPVSYMTSGACTASGSTLHITGAGSCTVTASQSGNADYNPAQSASRTFAINKGNVSIKVVQYGVMYDGKAHTATGTATGVGGVDLSAELSLSNTAHTNVGTYSDSWSFTDSTGNYNNANGTVTDIITAASATVTAIAAGKTYGDPDPALTATETGFTAADAGSITLSANRASGQNAGTYTITPAASGAALANYSVTYKTAVFTIAKATLTVTADNKTKLLDAANPAFTATYTGFKNGETLTSSGTTGAPGLTTIATITSPVGSYTITAAAGSLAASNYTFAFASGKLTILYASSGTCNGSPGHAILPPVNSDGTSVFKGGRTVPIQFRVCDANGASIGTPGVVSSFLLTGTYNGTLATEADIVSATTNDTAFRWDSTNQQWIFNLSTNGLSLGQTYIYTITLNDGTIVSGTTFAPAGTASFQFGLR